MGRIVAIAYVAVVTAVTAYAFRPGADGFNTAEGVAAALTLPVIVPALPVIYVVGALAWNVAGSDNGDPTLPVTLTFAAMMTVIAGANAWLVNAARRRLSARRASSG